jgi:3-oxoacyl-[acyl-carrier protein] reductase
VDTGLEGKGVLVTGGAGGIGSAIVRAFAAEGARVCIAYNTSRERAESLAQQLGGIALQADLTNEMATERLFERAVGELGELGVLVANAGIWAPEEVPLWEMSLERWRSTISANLDATFLCCRAFLRHVRSTGAGNIVIVGSTAGSFGEAGHSDYAAAKGAFGSGMLKSLKNEITRIAPSGRVNCVAPGWTITEMARSAFEDPAAEQRITSTMALAKLARSDDVARAVVFLSSDLLAGHITGEVVTVAGGMEGRVLR